MQAIPKHGEIFQVSAVVYGMQIFRCLELLSYNNSDRAMSVDQIGISEITRAQHASFSAPVAGRLFENSYHNMARYFPNGSALLNHSKQGGKNQILATTYLAQEPGQEWPQEDLHGGEAASAVRRCFGEGKQRIGRAPEGRAAGFEAQTRASTRTQSTRHYKWGHPGTQGTFFGGWL